VTVVLGAGPDRAVIEPKAGGRLGSLVAGGRERLVDRVQPGAALPAISWGSFLMAPWAGRISDGRLDWAGKPVQLERNLAGQAIHGTVFDVPWQVEAEDGRSVELRCEIDPGRWPFGGLVRQGYRLEPGLLRIEASVQASQAMPAALGWHPWFSRAGGDVAVTVLADERLRLDADLIPTGERVAVDGPDDLRAGPLLGDRRLDDVFVNARGPATVRWSDLQLAIEFEPPLASVVVFTPPGSVCVEPQTAWPDAPRLVSAGITGTGLVELRPGATLAVAMTWRW
jgi:aldose 1-epimerase